MRGEQPHTPSKKRVQTPFQLDWTWHTLLGERVRVDVARYTSPRTLASVFSVSRPCGVTQSWRFFVSSNPHLVARSSGNPETPHNGIDPSPRSVTQGWLDRDQTAAFALEHAASIRRRIRGKIGPSIRRVFDSQDIVSTVLRRLDLYISRSNPSVTSESDLWALIMRIAHNAVIDKARIIRRLQATEGEDSEFARLMLDRFNGHAFNCERILDLELGAIFDHLSSGDDQQILWLWLTGHELVMIGEIIGVSPDTVRKRWQRIRQQLREHIEPQESQGRS